MLEVLKNNTILKTITPFFEQNNGNAYIVGGFLRDCLLKRPSCDVDIVTDKNKAYDTAKRLADYINGYLVELDNTNNIYRVVFADKVNYVDIADCTGKNIEEDLKRRDFTINALAYDIKNNTLIDVVNAQDDLKKRIITLITCVNYSNNRLIVQAIEK